RHFHAVHKPLLDAKLFEVDVNRVCPCGRADVVVDKPTFSGALKDAVRRMFRIEHASERSIERTFDSEQARRYRRSSWRTRWIADELPLPFGVDRRLVRVIRKHCRNRRSVFREPRFAGYHVE